MVADDASTDGTRDILIKYSEKYPEKVKLILNEHNVGITPNCNKAFFACSGEYVALFAGDDVFLPGKLTAQVKEFMNDKDVVLCYHPVQIFDSASNEVLYTTYQLPREDIHNVRDLIVRGGIYGSCSVMVRRSACPIGGYDEQLPIVSDWLFSIEVALCGKIVKVDKILARYRKHFSGASARSFELLNETICTLDLLVEKYSQCSDIVEFCRLGKARYIIGEAYRQVMLNNLVQAYELSRKVITLCPSNFKYRIFMWLCFIFKRCKFISVFMVPLFIKAKVTVRKSLG